MALLDADFSIDLLTFQCLTSCSLIHTSSAIVFGKVLTRCVEFISCVNKRTNSQTGRLVERHRHGKITSLARILVSKCSNRQADLVSP